MASCTVEEWHLGGMCRVYCHFLASGLFYLLFWSGLGLSLMPALGSGGDFHVWHADLLSSSQDMLGYEPLHLLLPIVSSLFMNLLISS